MPNNIARFITIAVLSILFAFIQAFAFSWLVSFPFFQLVLDGLLSALLFTGLIYLLWKVVRYGKFEALDIYQRFINYTALGLLTVVIWTGLNYVGTLSIYGYENAVESGKILPVKVLIAVLLYLVTIQFLYKISPKIESLESFDDDASELSATTDETIKEEIQLLERIVIKTGQKIHVVDIKDIVYLQAEGDYVRIFTDSEKFLKEETMKYFQMHLSENQFMRVHRSYIVNIAKILRIELYEKQNQQLMMSNGDKIKISSSGYKRLREALRL